MLGAREGGHREPEAEGAAERLPRAGRDGVRAREGRSGRRAREEPHLEAQSGHRAGALALRPPSGRCLQSSLLSVFL